MAVQNQLKNKGPQRASLTAYLSEDAVKKQINQVVGGKGGTRFISSIISAYQATPALRECTNPSILNAALLGEALNLSPSPQLGQYYMVPFKNNKQGITTATFVLGYKGLVQLAIRSGYYRKLNALPIKEGELIRYDPLEEEIEVSLIDDEEEREKAPTVGYYAMFEYENGFKKTMYWSKAKMMTHADKYSKAFNAKTYQQILEGKIPEADMWKYSSFWYKDFDGMAVKTMLRQIISKWGIMSIELEKAMQSDGAAIRDDGSAEYVDMADEDEDESIVATQEYQEAPAEPVPEPVKAHPAPAPKQTKKAAADSSFPPEEPPLPGQISWEDTDLMNAFWGQEG